MPAERTAAFEVRPFFEDYEALLRSCDLIFCGASFAYRVSGVAYEALSYGKPLVCLDCTFAQKLQDNYPHMIFVIKDVNDIPNLDIDTEKVQDEHRRFLRDHAFETIRDDISRALHLGKTP
jgi:hypothetical protein